MYFFSKNLWTSLSAKARNELTDNNIIYLENPLFIQRNKTSDFQMINDIIASLVERWKTKFLSSADKATLIQSVS